MVRFTKLIFFILFLSGTAFSATIKGTVTDAVTHEKLYGATVYINELKTGATSGSDGTYILKNLPEGSFTITCSYLSHQKIEKKISVKKSDVLVIDFSLTDQNTELGGVTVNAHTDKSTDISARSMEKNANQVINIISAKTIESLPDLNVADVMQRVSGVSMLKNSSGSSSKLIIRGMPPRYNSTLVNGIVMSKSVSLDMFGSDLVGRIEVTKALTPDLEPEGIGGTVNIIMKEAPDKPFFHVQLGTGYNQYYFNHGFLTFDPKTVAKKDFNQQYGSDYVPAISDFPRQNLIIKSESAMPNLNGNISMGRRFFNNKLGLMIAGDLQKSYMASTNNSNSYNPDPNAEDPNTPKPSQWEQPIYCREQSRYGGFVKLDYKVNNNNQIIFYNSLFKLDELRAREVIDTLNENGRTVPGTGTVHQYTQTITDNTGILSSVLTGNHKILKYIDIDWTMAYSLANSESPDYATVYLTKTIDSVNKLAPYYMNYSKAIVRTWQWDKDESKTANLSISYKPVLFNHLLEFKAGGMARSRFIENYANDYNFDASVNNNLYPNPDILTVPVSVKNDQQLKGNAVNNPGNYRAWENVQAVYGMVKTDIGKLEVLTGLRVEFTNMHNEHNQNNIQIPVAHAKFSYYDPLASLHLNYKLTDIQNLRLSVYQAINRPYPTEVIPYSDPRPGGQTGNDKLNHTRANCYDLRYEIYPGKEEVFTAGLFYKKLNNAIEELVSAGTESKSFQNVKECTNYGFELVAVKNIRNININLNYTYTYSSIEDNKFYQQKDPETGYSTTITKTIIRPLVGQSPHIFNVGLSYHNTQKSFKCSLAYTMQGEHLVNVSSNWEMDTYQKNLSNLGATVEQTIYKKFVIVAKVSNILASPMNWYYKSGYFVEKINTFQTYFVALKFSI